MLDKDIDKARDAINDNLDTIIDGIRSSESDLQQIKEAMDGIYDICNGADQQNWRDCIARIQDIAREHS